MLFEPGKIGKLEIPNRIILSPHASNTGGERGDVTPDLIAYYQRRAEGGAGAITIGTVRVATQVDGLKLSSRQLCIDYNSSVAGFYKLTEAVHREGAKIIVQFQPGSGANVGALAEMDQWIPGIPMEPVSPSGVAWPGCPKPRVLSTAEVEKIVHLAGKAAERAKWAEFDAIEINAHARYLLAQFISPQYNKRRDKYGKDRLRLLLEMIEAIHKANSKDFPIIVRYTIATWPFPQDETFEEREDVKEAQAIAKRLEAAGVAAIHTSYNYVPWLFPEPSSHWPENFSLPMSKALKKAVKIPILLTGRVRDPDIAESVLRDGDADFIDITRPLIADPDWPKKHASGRTTEIWSCIACNECFRSIERHLPVRCTINPTAARELLFDYRKLVPAKEPKKVMVIGGGAAGMEAARVAALRGHRVMLVEKEGELGTKIEFASRLPYRKTFKDINSYYATSFKNMKDRVEIARGSEVTPELIDDMEKEGEMPDIFIVATGGTPFIPDVPGAKEKNVCTFLDVVASKAQIGKTVVIVGAGIIGCEVALLLNQPGKQVTLVELPGFRAGSDIDGFPVEKNVWAFTEEELQKAGIKPVSAEKLVRITDKSAVFEDGSGKELVSAAETVVIALGFTPVNELAQYLASKGKMVYTIGDAKKTGKIKDATYDALVVASRI